MKKLLTTLFIIIGFLLQLLPVQDKGVILAYKSDEKVTLGKLVKDLVKVIKMENTNLSIIMNDKLDQEINISLKETPISPEEAYQLLETVLANYDFAVIQKDDQIRIVNNSDALRKAIPTAPDKSSGNQFITQIIRLRYVEAKDILGVLQNFTKNIKELTLGNLFVITDYAENITRITKIINNLDVQGLRPVVRTYQLKYVSAEDMENSVLKTYQKLIPQNFLALAMPMTNSLLIITPGNKETLIQGFIEKMDMDDFYSLNYLKVFSLNYSNAEEMKKNIESVLNVPTKGKKFYLSLIPDARTNSIIAASSSGKIIDNIESIIERLDKLTERSTDMTIYQLKNASVKECIPVLQEMFPELKGGEKKSYLTKDFIKLTGDERTNKLYLTAPDSLREKIEKMIKSLDSSLQQVMVEVLIVEVSLRMSKSLGIEWGSFNKQVSDKRMFASSQMGLRGSVLSSQGLNVGLFNGEVDLQKLKDGDINELTKIEAVMAMYENDSDFNILSAPKIFVLDGKEAKIVVGEEIATPQGVIRSLDTGNTDVTNFDYKNVGVDLTIKPKINDTDEVTLEITQNITKRQEETLYEFQIPVFTKREAKTTVKVNGGETVVLAGMVSEDKTLIVDKTPVLGDIPLLGHLFRKTRKTSRKTNLHIFITPHIGKVKDIDTYQQYEKPVMISRPSKQRINEMVNRKKDVEKFFARYRKD